MKMNKMFFTLLLLLSLSLLLGIGADQPPQHPQNVSLIQLLATPEKYHRKFIAVEGFYHGETECSALFICKEHAKYFILENSIWLGVKAKNADTNKIEHVNNTYIRVEGVFNYTPRGGGHLGGWSSELNDISLFVKRDEINLSEDKK